ELSVQNRTEKIQTPSARGLKFSSNVGGRDKVLLVSCVSAGHRVLKIILDHRRGLTVDDSLVDA
ncbi:hypothetical protein RRG08_048720, partial [Elysia crispata]